MRNSRSVPTRSGNSHQEPNNSREQMSEERGAGVSSTRSRRKEVEGGGRASYLPPFLRRFLLVMLADHLSKLHRLALKPRRLLLHVLQLLSSRLQRVHRLLGCSCCASHLPCPPPLSLISSLAFSSHRLHRRSRKQLPPLLPHLSISLCPRLGKPTASCLTSLLLLLQELLHTLIRVLALKLAQQTSQQPLSRRLGRGLSPLLLGCGDGLPEEGGGDLGEANGVLSCEDGAAHQVPGVTSSKGSRHKHSPVLAHRHGLQRVGAEEGMVLLQLGPAQAPEEEEREDAHGSAPIPTAQDALPVVLHDRGAGDSHVALLLKQGK
mmetsp:Transcript_1474/g.3195  ORF Transcript_1474/g.3195 Transcript_1474/m.3195 type:complete len:321 (+) Transcript_1474:243-1205(+)